MPFINVKCTEKISDAKEKTLKTELGKAITILGKTESWLMLDFEDECRMYFKGSNDSPIAFAEVKIFGSASDSALDSMTEEMTRILSGELGVSPANVYVKYELCDHWGWNGSNF
ncbi:MAG: phenylpyruvate tautomerase MIF-related protein [Oscillospiraceae bacterium]|nr:phenylpyruvate tautomerase MIF-related protein [Oscillospiraceae bacterium]